MKSKSPLTAEEIKKLHALFKLTDKITKGLIRHSVHNNENEIAYQFFRSYYHRASLKLTREEIPEIRLNMLSLAKKLIRDQQEEVEGVQNG